jgi:hypothetical protein
MANTATSTANPQAQTPNQIATNYKAPIYGGAATINPSTPYTPGALGTSINPIGNTQAPAVVTSNNASNVVNSAITKNTNASNNAAIIAANKQNLTTTYDAQGNMIKTGQNGYQQVFSKGQPGYIPNPADVAKQQQQQQQQQQSQKEQQQTAALTSAAGGVPNGETATGGMQTAVYDNNGQLSGYKDNAGNFTPQGNQNTPQNIDVTTQDGQATWYNQNPQAYESWANTNGISSDEQFQVKVLAGNQNILSIQNQGNNALQQYRTGLLNNEEQQIAALTNMWNAMIDAQRNANDSYVAASALASARAGGQYDPMGSLAEANRAIQTGLDRVTEFQSQEQAAIAAVQNAFMTNDYNAVTANLAQQEKNQADMLNNLKTVNDSIVKAKDDAQAQANYVATTQYNEVTKPIQDIASAAKANGATDKQVAQIDSAKTVDDALNAAGDLLQTSTNPTIALYLQYKRGLEAQGKPFIDFTSFQKQQNQLDINKAAAIAFAQESAKASADKASGNLTTKQLASVKAANDALDKDPIGKNYSGVVNAYANILAAADSKDPATQASMLASFIKMSVPASTTLRGNSQVLSNMFGNTLATSLIKAQTTFDDRGTLNPEDVASIRKAADMMYNNQYLTYSSVVKSIAASMDDPEAAKHINDLSQPLNAEVVDLKAKDDVNTFFQSHSTDMWPNGKTAADNIMAMYAIPGTTDTQVFNWLKANGKITQ